MKVIAIKDYTAYWNEKDKRVIVHDKSVPAVKEGTIFELDFLKNEEENQMMLDQLRQLGVLIPFSEYRQNRINEVLDDDTTT